MQIEKRKVAIYCRVASKDDFAIESQCQNLRHFAAAQGYEDCTEYLDNGVNGLTLDRPALNSLNDDIIKGKIQIAFVASASRIGRDFGPVFKWLDFAKSSSVKVISQSGDIQNGETLHTISKISKVKNKKRNKRI